MCVENSWIAFQGVFSRGPTKSTLRLDDYAVKNAFTHISKMMKKFENVMEDLPIFLREVVDYFSKNQDSLVGR